MSRRRGFGSLIVAMARESAKSARQAERAARAADRQRAAYERQEERFRKQASKLERQEYLESRLTETQELNEDLSNAITGLSSILEHTLEHDDTINFDSLRITEKFPRYKPSFAFSEQPPAPLGFFAKLFPWSMKAHQNRVSEHERRRLEAEDKLGQERDLHETRRRDFKTKVEARDREIDEFSNSYFKGDQDAVEGYNSMVLDRSEYPEDFPKNFQVGYIVESNELVIEYELPSVELIPVQEEARYVKAKDEIVYKNRKPKDIKELYQDVVASIAIRTLHEVFEADQAKILKVAVFNGIVQARDPATGKQVKPCLISVRATKERFEELDLKHINKAACLRNLGAQVSSRPEELLPVKPVVEFDMIDKRFVDQADMLSAIESRPNLMDLTPGEFEHLVSNLFGKWGLESKLTRSSRDGGVDCVAFDCRPVLGGKVIIQAKRYKHTVGVSAVRDLYGTMQHEGANKGILVTTSGFGPDAFEFVKDKPMELIAGSQLLYLLEQIGIQSRIVFPEDGKAN